MTLTDAYQITTVAFSDTAEHVFTSGIENVIKAWDVRNQKVSLFHVTCIAEASKVVMSMAGHSDTVTGLQLSPDGTHLLTNSMDNTLRTWDIRPYAPKDRSRSHSDRNADGCVQMHGRLCRSYTQL